MSFRIITTSELIEKSAELFATRGYHHTSVADVAAFCGLKKASVYHHITSKKELGMKVIQSFHQEVANKVFAVAYQTELKPAERLDQFIEAIANYYATKLGGCLVGNFSLEASYLDKDFRELCEQYFDDFKKAFVAILGQRKGVEELADDAVAMIQGYIMAAQVRADAGYIHAMKDRLKFLVMLGQ